MEKLQDFIKEFNIVKIDNSNIEDVFHVCKKNCKYYKYLQEEATLDSVKSIMTDLPPNKTMKDKYFVGFYKCNNLVAILDLIDGYPNRENAFIGLFMVDMNNQNSGVGKQIISQLISFLKSEKYYSCDLGVIEDNKEALCFWGKLGFERTGVVYTHEKYKVIMMTYLL